MVAGGEGRTAREERVCRNHGPATDGGRVWRDRVRPDQVGPVARDINRANLTLFVLHLTTMNNLAGALSRTLSVARRTRYPCHAARRRC